MTRTEIQLVAVYGPAVPLDAVCEPYFGLQVDNAQRLAAKNALPVPTFRLRESLKCPLMVKAADLAAWIDTTHEQALASWQKSQL